MKTGGVEERDASLLSRGADVCSDKADGDWWIGVEWVVCLEIAWGSRHLGLLDGVRWANEGNFLRHGHTRSRLCQPSGFEKEKSQPRLQ